MKAKKIVPVIVFPSTVFAGRKPRTTKNLSVLDEFGSNPDMKKNCHRTVLRLRSGFW